MNIIGKATSNTHYEIHLLLTNDKQQDDDILSYKQKTHLYKCNIYVMHDIWEGYIKIFSYSRRIYYIKNIYIHNVDNKK